MGFTELERVRRHVRFIGGGTCAGKTTLAHELARSGGYQVFSVDDRLDHYAKLAEQIGSSVANNVTETDFARFWMRDPSQQFREMWQFYRDVFPFVLIDVANAIGLGMPIDEGAQHEVTRNGKTEKAPADCCESQETSCVLIAEGIAFLPSLLRSVDIPCEHCMFLTAEKSVHDERYAQRDWVYLMLDGCEDKARAFELWMQRDELFSAAVRAECVESGYNHFLVE